jgi:hypothetical protein
MDAIWDIDSYDDDTNEALESKEFSFALMAMVSDISYGMDVETTIAIKNITDPSAIEVLKMTAEDHQEHHKP